MTKPKLVFPTRSDTNRAVQSQNMVRDWKFWIKKVEELYYPSSKNKGTDQLRSYCEADLRLCFRLCRLLFFPGGGSNKMAYCVFIVFLSITFTDLKTQNVGTFK